MYNEGKKNFQQARRFQYIGLMFQNVGGFKNDLFFKKKRRSLFSPQVFRWCLTCDLFKIPDKSNAAAETTER